MLIYRVARDDGTKLAYQLAMQHLDRTEGTLRVLRQRTLGPSTALGHGVVWKDVVARIIQVAIDRAVDKKIRLMTVWWKEEVFDAPSR